jgi:hypothetical protein
MKSQEKERENLLKAEKSVKKNNGKLKDLFAWRNHL